MKAKLAWRKKIHCEVEQRIRESAPVRTGTLPTLPATSRAPRPRAFAASVNEPHAECGSSILSYPDLSFFPSYLARTRPALQGVLGE